MDKQAAREKAWEQYDAGRAINCPHKQTFDAGYKAAGEWVRIETADDLPKEDGKYDWTTREGKVVTLHWVVGADGTDWLISSEYGLKHVTAWRPRPEPFTEPLTEQTGGENGTF